jgi:hypothetical protein
VRHLASGNPVLVQDTGFSRTLPVGKGLEEYFDAELVLARFCEQAGTG